MLHMNIKLLQKRAIQKPAESTGDLAFIKLQINLQGFQEML